MALIINERAEGGNTYVDRLASMSFDNQGEIPQVLVQYHTTLNGEQLAGVNEKLIMFDPAMEFPLLHPETGATLRQTNAGEVYAIVLSIFAHAATHTQAELSGAVVDEEPGDANPVVDTPPDENLDPPVEGAPAADDTPVADDGTDPNI